MWSIGRIILTRKNQNSQRKPGPVPLATTNPIQTGSQGNLGICGERSRTNSAIYLWCEEWPKNAFYCIDQSRCVVLHVACVTNTGCVLFERSRNRNCHTAVLSEVGYIYNIWNIFFNIKYPSLLRNSLFWWQLQMIARNLHVISVPWIKCPTTESWCVSSPLC